MSTTSNYHESVFWLQSHMLPCNYGETPVFWNPVPGLDKVGCHACARIPDVNSSAINQRQYRDIELSIWLNWLWLNVCKHYRVCVEVSTILGDVMDSQNSKTIEQRWSDSGCRLGDDRECSTGPNLDPN